MTYECANCNYTTENFAEAVTHRDSHLGGKLQHQIGKSQIGFCAVKITKRKDGTLYNYKRAILFGGCNCRTPGKDDGDTTCFEHHDCSDGSCTHTDGGE